MTLRRLVTPRGRMVLSVAGALAFGLAGCSAPAPSPIPTPVEASAAASATPVVPTPTPSPSPQPTPRFTNPADTGLAALLPSTVAGHPLVVAPIGEFALTPGDVGLAYGEIGLDFASLAIAYVEQPRLTLYAVRTDGDPVSTEDLEPHLATAGRYLGIAGLDPEPWELITVADRQVWTRPGDIATAAGTVLYTWSDGEFVFLLIGVDDAANRALIAALPGEPPPPTPPDPSPNPSASGG